MGKILSKLYILQIFLFLTGCNFAPQTSIDNSVTYVQSLEEVDGKVTTGLTELDRTHLIKSNGENLGEFEALFPAGSLSIGTDVTFEKGVDLASDSLINQLELSSAVLESGSTVVMTPSVEQNPSTPITMSLAIPSSSLGLNAKFPAVLYRTINYETGKVTAGVIGSESITPDVAKLKFSTSFFGMFQTVYMDAEESSLQIDSAFGIETIENTANTPPFQIFSRVPVIVEQEEDITVNGKYFKSTMTVASNSADIEDLKVLDSNTLKFKLASNTTFGEVGITLSTDEVSQDMNLFYVGSTTDYPIINLDPEDVCSGQQYYDKMGTLQLGEKDCGAPGNCTIDGEIGCVTSSAYPAVDVTTVVSSSIVQGQSILGVSGSAVVESHSVCTTDGDGSGCVTTARYKSADTSAYSATDLKSGVSVAGVNGTLNNCATDGEVGCVTTSSHPAANTAGFNAGEIKKDVTIAGVIGTLITSAPSDCSTGGEIGCVSTLGFPALDSSALTLELGKISSSVTIAGQTGTMPNCMNDNQIGCYTTTNNPAVIKSQVIADKMKSTMTIAGVTGVIVDCVSDGNDSCLLNGGLKAADSGVYGPADIKFGKTIGGVAGSIPNCSADGDGGCLLAGTLKAAETSNYGPADVKAGKTIAGISGSIQTCSSDGQGSCIVDGSTHVSADKANAVPNNIRVGVTLGGAVGRIKVNCKNRGNTSISDFNADSAIDIWETIDDWNNNFLNGNLVSPTGFTAENVCDATNEWMKMGTGGSTAGACNEFADQCVMKDKNSYSKWSELAVNDLTFVAAQTHCTGLNFGGISNWRVPTQKELMQAYVNGIATTNNQFFVDLSQTTAVWSSTSSSSNTDNGYVFNLSLGTSFPSAKGTNHSVICVSD